MYSLNSASNIYDINIEDRNQALSMSRPEYSTGTIPQLGLPVADPLQKHPKGLKKLF